MVNVLNVLSAFRGLRGWEVQLENAVGSLNRISYACSSDIACCSFLPFGWCTLGLSSHALGLPWFCILLCPCVSSKNRLRICGEEFTAQNNTPLLQMDRSVAVPQGLLQKIKSQNKALVAEPNITAPKWLG